MCDRDPSVMGASLCLLYDLAKEEQYARELKELVPSMVNILKQVIDHRLPRDFDYHRLPAPWIQIKLLQILAIVGKNDKVASEAMYDALRETMQVSCDEIQLLLNIFVERRQFVKYWTCSCL